MKLCWIVVLVGISIILVFLYSLVAMSSRSERFIEQLMEEEGRKDTDGIVMMLLLAKVPKKGVFTICTAIQAILFLLVGAFWFIPIGLIIGGVICDFLVMSRNEITMKSMMAAYALFSAIFAFSAICPIKFLQSAFVGAMEKNNIAPEYIQGMLSITSVPMLVVIVAAGLVGGLIGGFIGQKALKKHFIKAGLVSVK